MSAFSFASASPGLPGSRSISPSTRGPALTDELLREVRRLKLRTRRRVDNLLSGEYHSAYKGQGIEFAEVREYQPGDDVRAIDWNVTARSPSPEGGFDRAFVKRFAEERQLTVMLVVDQSASGLFGTVARTKARLAVEVAAVLALAATRNNDRVGLTVFSDKVDRFVPPAKGQGQSIRVMTELLTSSPGGRSTDLAGTLHFLGNVLRRRASVFVISDFVAEGWERPLQMLAKRHTTAAITLADPRERELPDLGLVELQDAESGTTMLIDSSSRAVRDAYKKNAQEREATLSRTLTRLGLDRIALNTDKPFTPELARHFRLREHRR